MLQNSDGWSECLEFLTSMGQSDESDRVWRLLSPSKNVKKQTNKLTCGLIGSVYQKSERVDADDTFPIPSTIVLLVYMRNNFIYIRFKNCNLCKAYILLNTSRSECIFD